MGNRTQLTDKRGAQSFGYDSLDRLTSASHPLLATPQAFAYDPVGNRTTGGSVVNVGNQLTADATHTYQYDDNGNLTRKTLLATGNYTHYTYDAENRLIKVEDFVAGNPTPTATSTYRYDGLGRRIEKVANGQTRRYIYDREDILLEYDGSNQLLARYTHGQDLDEPLAMTRGGAIYFYHADGLGTITELSDGSGTVARSHAYESFGKMVEQTGTIENPYAYAGRELDSEAGLYYYRKRYYDPQSERFLQKDPKGFAGGGLNLYAYVENNPANYIDPLGLVKTGGDVRLTTDRGKIACFGGRVQIYVPKEKFTDKEIRCGIYDCVIKHEEVHRNYAASQRTNVCVGVSDYTTVIPSDPGEMYAGEVQGYNAAINCLGKIKNENRPCCGKTIDQEINFYQGLADYNQSQLNLYRRQQGIP